MATGQIQVARVQTNVDLRCTHWMRKVYSRGLRPGQVTLCLNAARNMYRLVTCTGAIYSDWDPPATKYDVDAIEKGVRAMSLTIVIPGDLIARVDPEYKKKLKKTG